MRSALWNPFANMASLDGNAVTMVRGEGSWVFDDHGRAYLDAIASLWYCNVGHGRAELAEAAAAQMRQLAGFQAFESFSSPPAEALARRVAGLTRSTRPRSSPAATGALGARNQSRSRSPGSTLITA